MHILTNYILNRGKENYGSESFCVSVEADFDMGIEKLGDVADALFAEAKAAVQRQIEDAAAPNTAKPVSEELQRKEEAPAQKIVEKPASGKGTALPATDKQVGMVRKLMRENFKNGNGAKAWLTEKFGADNTTQLTRKAASCVIEALLVKQRMAE